MAWETCFYDKIIGRVTGMEKNLPVRKRNRLVNFDYSTEGAYFITVCTNERKQILSKISVGAIHESPALKILIYRYV